VWHTASERWRFRHICLSEYRMADPALWLQTRAAFMRTTAAWSMAGHIVGLGDRHCDNLLIDVQRGTNVQIDFGHLFDSARDLPYPEVMAFRLSQNMVDSFGVYGVEGGFRATCCAGVPTQLAAVCRVA
jgi:phosphatidylinositol kinase/protein kinase (PI-3  family)